MRLFLGPSPVLAAALALGCSNAAVTPAGSGSAPASSEKGRPAASRASEAAALDLQAMLSPVPEYEGSGRNLFAFGAARRGSSTAEIEPAPVDPEPREIVTVPPRLAPRPGPSLSSRLDVKYAGFLEKTGADGVKSKYAIFLNGNEILAGAEGELVANRFKVVSIGLESVTVSPTGSGATQRIPLQSR